MTQVTLDSLGRQHFHLDCGHEYVVGPTDAMPLVSPMMCRHCYPSPLGQNKAQIPPPSATVSLGRIARCCSDRLADLDVEIPEGAEGRDTAFKQLEIALGALKYIQEEAENVLMDGRLSISAESEAVNG